MPRVPAVAARSLSGVAEPAEAGHKGRPADGRPGLIRLNQRYFSSFVGSSDSPISADKQSIWLSV